MKPIGRPAADQQPKSGEFVPKRDLDRAQQELDRLRKHNERLHQEAEWLKQETERLRRERGKPNASGLAANPVGATAVLFRSTWMSGSQSHCPSAAPIAEAA